MDTGGDLAAGDGLGNEEGGAQVQVHDGVVIGLGDLGEGGGAVGAGEGYS